MKVESLLISLALAFATCSFVAPSAIADGGGGGRDGGGYGEYLEKGSDVVDVWGTANDATESFADMMQAALRKSTDEKFLDGAVKSLDAVGVDGGWTKQIGKLGEVADSAKKFGKVLDIAGKVLSYGASASNVYEAYQSGNQAEFRRVVADEITKQVASWIGGLVSKAIVTNGQGMVVAAAAGGPIAMILAEAGVLVTGYYAGKGTEKAIEWAVSEVGLRNVFEGFADKVWDALHDSDPFDNPNPDPGDGYGGSCPAPGSSGGGGGRSKPIGLTPFKY